MRNSTTAARIARMIDVRRARRAAPSRIAGDGAGPGRPEKAVPKKGVLEKGVPGRGVPKKVVVVGGGFGGLGVLRYLEARLPAGSAELELISPVDHLLYTSLLPQVAAGDVEPRHLAVSVRRTLSCSVLRLGHAVDVDPAGRTVCVVGRDGSRFAVGWDRLVLAPGSLTRIFDIPGLAEHALGLKNLAEAVYLRDHVLRQLEYADACPSPAGRRARCTIVIVGAGYTGTELAAQLRQFTLRAIDDFPRLAPADLRMVLLDLAPRVLPELGPALSREAMRVLRARGVEIRPETTVCRAAADSVTLTDGDVIPAHTLVWCAGVTPNPVVQTLGTETVRGRLVVDEYLRVPGLDGVFALGDAAAVPDVTRGGAPAGQTAQHAVRQGAAAGRNVAASLGYGTARPYRHRDLGFVVDLGGADAAANPLGITLTGRAAALVTRGYHLYALRSRTNRSRVVADWLLAATAPEQVVQLGFMPPRAGTIAEREDVRLYAGERPD